MASNAGLAAGWVCAGLLLACGGRDTTALERSPDAAALPERSPRVVLGTGVDAFELREDDAHVLLVAGPQGAHHVWASFLAYGFDTDVLRMNISTRWEDRPGAGVDMRGNVAVRPSLDADGAEALAMMGWPAVVRQPLCSDGWLLRVELRVMDGEGRSASDSRRWVLDVPEQERASACPPDEP